MSFLPADGHKSRREVLYDFLRDKPSGELIPYADLPYDQEVVRGLLDSVAKTFNREQQRHLVCVRGEGWKIVRGVDQTDDAMRKRRQATRRMGRAVQIISTTDRREMSAEERVRADQELITATTGYGVLRGLAVKAPRIGVEEIKQWQREGRQA